MIKRVTLRELSPAVAFAVWQACLQLSNFGFSKVDMLDLGAESTFRETLVCSYLMAPGGSFSMPQKVESFRSVLNFQKKALGYECGGSDGLQPSQTMSDFCRRALYRLEAHCSDQWSGVLPTGCEHISPPFGFTDESTLKELCPVECTKMSQLDLSALFGTLQDRERQHQRELEAQRQRELEAKRAARAKAQAEARRKEEAMQAAQVMGDKADSKAAEALATTPGAAAALANPDLSKAFAAHPDFLPAMAKSPGFASALANPDLAKALGSQPDLLSAVGSKPDIAIAMANTPGFDTALANPDLAKALGSQPDLLSALGEKPDVAIAFANPDLSKVWTSQPDLLGALANIPGFAAALTNPDLSKVLASQPFLLSAMAEKPGFATALANPDLGKVAIANPDLIMALADDPELAAAVAKNPALASAYSSDHQGSQNDGGQSGPRRGRGWEPRAGISFDRPGKAEGLIFAIISLHYKVRWQRLLPLARALQRPSTKIRSLQQQLPLPQLPHPLPPALSPRLLHQLLAQPRAPPPPGQPRAPQVLLLMQNLRQWLLRQPLLYRFLRCTERPSHYATDAETERLKAEIGDLKSTVKRLEKFLTSQGMDAAGDAHMSAAPPAAALAAPPAAAPVLAPVAAPLVAPLAGLHSGLAGGLAPAAAPAAAPVAAPVAVLSPRSIRFAQVMVQKEAAERMVAPVGSKDYSVLSVMLQAFARLRQLYLVPPTAFYPQPKVVSAVVELDFDHPTTEVDVGVLLDVVKESFRQRKRALRHSLKGYLQKRRLLLPLSWAKLRAEQLSPSDFIELTKCAFGACVVVLGNCGLYSTCLEKSCAVC
eukprot:g4174.t1